VITLKKTLPETEELSYVHEPEHGLGMSHEGGYQNKYDDWDATEGTLQESGNMGGLTSGDRPYYLGLSPWTQESIHWPPVPVIRLHPGIPLEAEIARFYTRLGKKPTIWRMDRRLSAAENRSS